MRIADYQIERTDDDKWHAGCVKFRYEDVRNVIELMKRIRAAKKKNMRRVLDISELRDGQWFIVTDCRTAVHGRIGKFKDEPDKVYMCTNWSCLDGCNCGYKHGFRYSWSTNSPDMHLMVKCDGDPTKTGELEAYCSEFNIDCLYTTSLGTNLCVSAARCIASGIYLTMLDLRKLSAYVALSNRVRLKKH